MWNIEMPTKIKSHATWPHLNEAHEYPLHNPVVLL